ncbi:MAG: hypothetical protein RLZZ272_684, partial [Actinomycetota bacterium]
MCPTAATTARVLPFRDGDATMKALLGGKGANLCEMTRIGLPVPPGFIVTTDACREYLKVGEIPAGLLDEVDAALAELEVSVGRRLGDPERPLLLSVRSGAPFSMPGMMDTVLDLGATPATAPALTAMADARFAWDARRRFLEMFGRVVLGVPAATFDRVLHAAIAAAGVPDERSLAPDDLERVATDYERAIAEAGSVLPEDPHEQLHLAIAAVFRSWNGDRARAYRRVERIPDDLG